MAPARAERRTRRGGALACAALARSVREPPAQEECRRDVTEFVEGMLEKGLLERV